MNQDFSSQIESQFVSCELTLYKIFGHERFDFNLAQYQNKVDWSGFYTQLKAEHSMRYLTKKWDDGAEKACLIQLFPKCTDLRIIRINHKYLSYPNISGQIKAQCIKNHLRQSYEQFKDLNNQKLIEYMGFKKVLVICIDAQDEQVIIPHELLIDDNFSIQHLLSFKRSNDGMLRTISYQFEGQEWIKMPSELQFEPYLLLQCKEFTKNW